MYALIFALSLKAFEGYAVAVAGGFLLGFFVHNKLVQKVAAAASKVAVDLKQ